MDKLNKNKIFEVTKAEPTNNKEKSIEFINSADSFKKRILNSDPITQESIQELKEKLWKTKILIFGQKISPEELNKISKSDIDVSKEILQGNFNHTSKLTYLFPDVLEALNGQYNKTIFLPNIYRITDEQAEVFSRGKGTLSLGILSTNDKQITLLTRRNGMDVNNNDLWLENIPFFTDTQIKLLSRYSGGLDLQGLSFISDNEAKILSEHKHDLNLGGLVYISDEQAKWLSRHKGKNLYFNKLKPTHKQKEILSHYQGEVSYLPSFVNSFKQELNN